MTAVMPQALEAERALLGGLLLASEAMDDLADQVDPRDFYSAANERIWRHMLDVHRSTGSVDVLLLYDRVQAQGDADACGGLEYVTGLPERCPTTANVPRYLQTIQDTAARRRLLKAAADLESAARDRSMDVEEALDRGEALLANLRGVGTQGFIPQDVAGLEAWEALEAAIAARHDGGRTYMSTGLDDLDAILSPSLTGGRQCIIAGRPGMGKSALALQIAISFARQGHGVGFFSLEMDQVDQVHRGWSQISGVPLDVFDTGHLYPQDMARLEDAHAIWHHLPLRISDRPGQTLGQIRSGARKLAGDFRRAGTPLAAIFVDYVGLMGLAPGQQRLEGLGQISRGLKTLSREMDLFTGVLSQLNRKVEDRSNKRPQMADLRECGDFEQDADAIVFAYRRGYYDEDADPTEAELIVAKQRKGRTGIVKVAWEGECTRFHTRTA